jgi:hypothetical protein
VLSDISHGEVDFVLPVIGGMALLGAFGFFLYRTYNTTGRPTDFLFSYIFLCHAFTSALGSIQAPPPPASCLAAPPTPLSSRAPLLPLRRRTKLSWARRGQRQALSGPSPCPGPAAEGLSQRPLRCVPPARVRSGSIGRRTTDQACYITHTSSCAEQAITR